MAAAANNTKRFSQICDSSLESGLVEGLAEKMECTDQINPEHCQPKVKMPCSSTNFARQDTGLCTDLQSLSLQSSSPVTRSYTYSKAGQPTSSVRQSSTVNTTSGNASSSFHRQQETAEWEELFNEKCRKLFEPDEDGDVQLHLAIASSNYEVADTLIRLSPDPECLDVQNKDSGYSPLHLAVLRNQPATVRALIIHGAKVCSRDKDGNTPLHLAAIHGFTECGDALLKPVSIQETSARGISGSPPSPMIDVVDSCNYYGEQCVHLSAMGGHCSFLHFLSWSNADMNAQEGRGGRTALHFAVGSRNLQATRCLVEPTPVGCGVKLDILDWYGRSPLHLAVMNGIGSDILNYLSHKIEHLSNTTSNTSHHVISLTDVDSEEEADSDVEETMTLEMHPASVLLGSNA
jgi:ankyrin repeat protein